MSATPETHSPEIQHFQDRPGRIAAAVVLGISFLAVAGIGGIMLYVVPHYEKMFRDFHAQLPAGTQTLLGISHAVCTCWFVCAPLILAGYTVLFLLALRGARKWWKIVLALGLGLTALAVFCVPVVVVALLQPLAGMTQSVNAGRP